MLPGQHSESKLLDPIGKKTEHHLRTWSNLFRLKSQVPSDERQLNEVHLNLALGLYKSFRISIVCFQLTEKNVARGEQGKRFDF